MNISRLTITVSAYVLFGTAHVMLREFADAYRYYGLRKLYTEANILLPALSEYLLPAAPFAWWCMLIPVLFAVGVGVRTPQYVSVRHGVVLLISIAIACTVMIGSFLPMLKVFRSLGFLERESPTALQLYTNCVFLVLATIWALAGVRHAVRANKELPSKPS